MLPGLGDTKKKLQLSVGWRIAEAERSYFDSRINHDFTRLWQPSARLSVMDVTARYQVNKRVSVLASLPIVFNKFSMLYPPLGSNIGKPTAATATGVGDLLLFGQTWLLNSDEHPFHNIAVGAGIKIPTGNWHAKDFLPDETGRNFQKRTVYPPAIMPGDGGVGVLVGAQGYRNLRNTLPIIHGGTIYGSANYLINARDTNGAPSMVQSLGVPLNSFFRTRLQNSVTDSYNIQTGIAVKIPMTRQNKLLKNARFRVQGNWEGVPTSDFIGQSLGFRQPGYTFSVGPGITMAYKNDYVSVDMPFVFARHVNPNESVLPGLPLRNGRAAPVNFNRQMGLIAPFSIVVRYARAF
jgi:hypothetical protein